MPARFRACDAAVPPEFRMLVIANSLKDHLHAGMRIARLIGMSKPKHSRTSFKYPVKSADVPVTQTMLFLIRDELSAKISETDHRLGAKIDNISDRMSIELHQLKILMEEQNARNIFVLDGLRSLFDRQDRLERRVNKARVDKAP